MKKLSGFSDNPDKCAIHEYLTNPTSQNMGSKFKKLLDYTQNRPSFEMWIGGDEYFDSLFRWVDCPLTPEK